MSDEPRELTVEQVAKELQVHKKRIYEWIHTGDLPAMDLGNANKHNYRVSREDLDAFKRQRRTVKQNTESSG